MGKRWGSTRGTIRPRLFADSHQPVICASTAESWVAPSWTVERLCAPRFSSELKAENRRIQRLGSTNRIEVLPQERDLAVCSTQEDHVVLEIHTACGLNEPF